MEARALVGKNVRRLRVAAGLSQEALGLSVGCEPSYIGRIERGKENVTLDLLESISRALATENMVPLFLAVEGDVPRGLRPGPKPRQTTKKDAARARADAALPVSALPNSQKRVERD